MSDTYRVLGSTSRTEIKVKGSRFIGEAFPVGSPKEAKERLSEVQRRERDATHHCMAYRTGPDGDELRFSDDGEPSGTAGKPILRQIDAAGVTNVLVVVTRYYGGTNLGTGGLIRAYGDAARESLIEASIKTITKRTTVRVRFAYPDTSPAMHTIQTFDSEMGAMEYGDETSINLGIRVSQVDAFVEAFENALSGRCSIEVLAD